MTKILLIEDEQILREEVEDWLIFENYEVLTSEDGLSGVEAALRHLPDLIISDITMPRLDGYGVLLEIRSHPATAAIPFIFVTARAAYEDLRKGMVSGADDYITKPFSRGEFLQSVQTRLEKKLVLEQKRQHEVDALQQALAQEQEQRKLRATLVVMFSHDFRNPLAGIQASIGLLRDYADRMDETRRRDHLNRMQRMIQQLLGMLDDMLLAAQLETGQLEFKPEALNVEQFFQDIVDEFRAIHSETHLILYESHFSDAFTGDARLLRQIAANLISNAIKYSPKGSEVRIILDMHEARCILTVQDQGIGIPEADQARLWQAFQRGSNTGNVSGTGIGLAIVKQATDLHGGTVQFESQVGKGTRFQVSLPASQAAQ